MSAFKPSAGHPEKSQNCQAFAKVRFVSQPANRIEKKKRMRLTPEGSNHAREKIDCLRVLFQ